MTDLRIIQQVQEKFIRERKWDRFASSQVFTHLIEELGEIASYLLYKEEYKVAGAGHKINEKDLQIEFGQAFSLFMQLAILADVDLETAWEDEMKQMEDRFSTVIWRELADRKSEDQKSIEK
ncbi:MAG: hypothetical protein ACXAB7_03875 [Candidatus Kariarchaeaceae archaeon]|jgi:NTP pyrophosphatase (non-canonical NTP hydrolase)